MRDAAHHAFQNAPVARAGRWIVQAAEAEGIHHRDGPRAHGEDVAQNPAHAGGRALKRLDETGVVVRFDLERDRQAVADVDDAGVLARPLQHHACLGGQLLQMHARAFVGTVLAPHHAENAELGVAGLATQQAQDFFVFSGRELMGRDHFRRDLAIHLAAAHAVANGDGQLCPLWAVSVV